MASSFHDLQQVESSRSSAHLASPHSIEQEVCRRLQQQPQIVVKSLVVHRTPNGVCLEGRIEASDDTVDIPRLMRGIPGLEEVIDRLVVTRISELPPRD